MPPKTQEIEGSEEAVQVLHKKLQSLFEKIDKKEQEAEEVEKVYIYIIFFIVRWLLSFHKVCEILNFTHSFLYFK